MCKTRTIGSKKHFFHYIINFCVSPLRVSLLEVPDVRTFRGPSRDVSGTSLAGCENPSALINISLEDDRSIFKSLQNLGKYNLPFIILKCSTFCLTVTFVFILLLLCTQMFLMLQFSWLEKGKKKAIQKPTSPPSRLLKLSFFQSAPLLFLSPDYQYLIFFQNTPTIPLSCLLET